MEVIFCRNKLPFSFLIRLLIWSKWSHCGILHGDSVIHATAANGVISEPLVNLKKRYKFEIHKMSGDKEKAVSLIGCKYNWFSLFGGWDYKTIRNRFYCHEFVAHCLHNLDCEPDTPQKKWVKDGLTPFVFRLFI